MVGEREMKGVLSKALKEYERRHCPKRRQARREKRKAKSVSVSPSSSSYSPSSGPLSVPAEVRDEVYLRDNGQCTFVGPDGNRCTCRTKLELDHVLPRAKGGSNHASNLRLTCKPHNQLYAELHFGKDLMQRKRA